MFNKIIYICNIFSVIFFVLALRQFSSRKTSIKGNNLSLLGILISLFSVLFFFELNYFFYLSLIIILIGFFLGFFISKKINISSVPELISLLHSFVGLCSILISYNNIYTLYQKNILSKNFLLEIFLANLIGSITFMGSIISYFKLVNIEILKFLTFFNNKLLMISLILLSFFFFIFLNVKLYIISVFLYLIIFLISCIIGYVLINKINSSDISIVISMLNSYSGWAASISGFVLNNDLLIIVGSLVGTSGFILAKVMCKSMNKSIYKVIIGNIFFTKKKTSTNVIDNIIFNQLTNNSVVNYLKTSRSIIIIPGYGMATSQSHFIIYKLVNILDKKYGLKIKFGIHPIAGRLPGHMNVLLAEAKIPYNNVYSLDEINKYFINNDLVLVIGGNDIINPRAIEDKDCSLYGMPVLKVWESNFVIIFKRTLITESGYSKVENSIFLKKNVGIILGDAKFNLNKIIELI